MNNPDNPANANPKQLRIFKKEYLIGISISFLTLVIFTSGLEFVGYLWEKKTAQESLGWTLIASRRLEFEARGDSDQAYFMLKPNRDYLWENIPVHINSNGLRTDEFEIPKPKGTYRILNLGDSIVFGWEVFAEESYGKRLEGLLNSQSDGPQYEVINAGVPTWSPDTELIYLKEEGLTYDPDLIILDFTIVNDVYGQSDYLSGTPDFFDWMRDNTYSWPFLTTQTRFILSRRVGPEAIPVLNPPKEPQFYYPLEVNDPNWERIGSTIVEMQNKGKEIGAKFVVIIFPTAYQLSSAQHPDTPQQVFQTWADAGRFDVIDLLPIYREECNNAPSGLCEGFENHLFADVWMHPNAFGHDLAAEALYEYIMK